MKEENSAEEYSEEENSEKATFVKGQSGFVKGQSGKECPNPRALFARELGISPASNP